MLVLRLELRGLAMVLAPGVALMGAGPRADAARAAVEARMADVLVVDDALIVDVADVHTAEIGDAAVVEVGAMGPIAAMEADAGIAEAVIDAAIEADMRPPIAGVPDIEAVAPTPVARSPEKPDRRRHHPGARDPVIAGRTPGPIARSPHVAGSGQRRLRIDRDRRRRHVDGNPDAHLGARSGSRGQKAERQQGGDKGADGTHDGFP